MIKIVFIFGTVAVVANIFFIWYAKRKGNKTKADNSSNLKDSSYANPQEFINSEEGKRLKQSAAAELSISIEELDRMSVDKITRLAKKKNLI